MSLGRAFVVALVASCGAKTPLTLEDGSGGSTSPGPATSAYHVCNNDAALQKALFDAYAPGGGVAACDSNVETCRGPMWLYSP